MNTISLMGRLTAQPELRKTSSGLSVCSFTMAVKRPMARDTTDYIPCVAWNKTAELVCTYVGKGELLALVGHMTTRKWSDSEGNTRTAYEVVADALDFVPKGKADAAPTPPAPQAEPAQDFEMIGDGDMPF